MDERTSRKMWLGIDIFEMIALPFIAMYLFCCVWGKWLIVGLVCIWYIYFECRCIQHVISHWKYLKGDKGK